MYQTTVYLPNIDDVKSFVTLAMQFPFEIDLISGRHVINAKSIMGVFSLPLSNPLILKANCDNVPEFEKQIKKYITE